MKRTNAFDRAAMLRACGAGAALLATATDALAQAEQTLLVQFVRVANEVPLSDGLTAGIALALAVAAFLVLRAGGAGGGRLTGWLLVLATGGLLLAATGARVVTDARAGYDPAVIDLAVSPGTLALSQYFPSLSQVEVTVTNTTGINVRVTDITLNPPSLFYVIDLKGSTCEPGLVLGPAQSCLVMLIAQET